MCDHSLNFWTIFFFKYCFWVWLSPGVYFPKSQCPSKCNPTNKNEALHPMITNLIPIFCKWLYVYSISFMSSNITMVLCLVMFLITRDYVITHLHYVIIDCYITYVILFHATNLYCTPPSWTKIRIKSTNKGTFTSQLVLHASLCKCSFYLITF